MKNIIKQILRENLMGKNKNEIAIIKIIDKYDSLKKGLKYIILNNKSNNAPYHNINHLLTVTKYCYNALKHMDMLSDDKSEDLLLAALFHDFNHSMGKEKDDVNIKEAKKGLKKFINDENLDLDLDFMDEIINATQYPYVIESKDLNIYQSIIRDADMCQIFEYDWLRQNIFGLSTELNLKPIEFLKGQRKFLEGIDFLTDYGKFLSKNYFNEVMEEFEILEDIIK